MSNYKPPQKPSAKQQQLWEEKATHISACFGDLVAEDPYIAAQELAYFAGEMSEVCPPRFIDPSWVGSLLDYLGDEYRSMNQAAQYGMIEQTLNLLRITPLPLARKLVAHVCEPNFVRDLLTEEPYYLPNTTEYVRSAQMPRPLIRHKFEMAKSAFFYYAALTKYSNAMVLADMKNRFPDFADRTMTAIAAIYFEMSVRAIEIASGTNASLQDHLNFFIGQHLPEVRSELIGKINDCDWAD